jgi:hypothetical protein
MRDPNPLDRGVNQEDSSVSGAPSDRLGQLHS